MPPLTSIVFTSYNHKEYLRQALESLLNQTYTNFELIIVDDCSTDGSQSILKEYQRDSRVNLILSKANSGSYVNSSNYGASFAKGDYLLFAQCDDFSEPNQLENLVNSAMNNPDCGVVYSMSNMVDENGHRLGDDYSIRESYFKNEVKDSRKIEGKLMRRFLTYSCVIPNLSAALIKRELYLLVNGLSTDFLVAADWDFWLKLSEATDFYYIKRPLNNFRQHGTTIRSSIKMTVQISEIYKMFYTHIKKYNLEGRQESEFKQGAGAIWFAFAIESKMGWLKSLPASIRSVRKIEPFWIYYLSLGICIQLKEYWIRKTSNNINNYF